MKKFFIYFLRVAIFAPPIVMGLFGYGVKELGYYFYILYLTGAAAVLFSVIYSPFKKREG